MAARLDRCRAQLLDPAHAHRSISEIAFALGFTSAAHFSRAFRARFGRSPRTLRAAPSGAAADHSIVTGTSTTLLP
ncbi:MAG: helix-turn-helix domain-containing protein [Myxococcales bacterium]|nr:helix-turn-helix domain-containing protein [Myxococcales bacterium]